MVGGFMSWGFPLGHLAGIQIRIHWTLLLYWGAQLNDRLGADDDPILFPWLLSVGLMFGSIFLHELGHCFVARRVGGEAHEVLLWPLGGLAFVEVPPRWKARLAVAAGGPLVTAAILALSHAGFEIAGRSTAIENTPAFSLARDILIRWNLLILIFNLIPLYPLDGGRIFHSLAWGFFGRHMSHPLNGYARASRVTYVVSLVTAIAGIALAIHWQEPVLAILLVLMALEAGSLRQGA